MAKKRGPMSEETKRKIGLANKGKTSWMKGKHPSQSTKNKTSESLMGHAVSDCARQKMRDSHRHSDRFKNTKGRKKFNRKHPYYADRVWEYEELKQQVYTRDSNTCALCGLTCIPIPGSRGHIRWYRLVAHHVIPIDENKPKIRYDAISNMVTLCKSCHKIVHGRSGSEDWRGFLRFFKRYLSKYKYKKLLLDRYKWAK